jgi:2-succinyl-5-enolpyruvyl-6-hydroxy-3-cyclohexene-1-carboxylate synthase
MTPILLHLCMDFKGQKSTPYIVDVLHQHGVEHVIICPGSRNAPFTLAFTRHGKFNCLSVIDERSAGYFALGLAQATGKPVAIVCTSGTATLNFAPAIAEAFHQQIPLIVLTADRPESWINQQDGQAIEQKNLYANIIAKSYHLKGELFCKDDLWHTEKVTNEAFHIAQSKSRPVHINVSFAESLYEDDYAHVNANKVTVFKLPAFFSYWETLLKDRKNVMVIVGQTGFDQAVISAVKKISKVPNAVVISENLANIPAGYHIVNATEALSFKNEKMLPDVVVYMGGPIVAKQLKKYIGSLSVPVIRVQLNDEEVDTFQHNFAIVKQSVANGMETLSDYLVENSKDSDFAEGWRSASDKAFEKRNHYVAQLNHSDLTVYDFLARQIPAGSNVHLGNSTPVRYSQLFNDLYPADCCFYSNRGTSGIDGSTSTAAGYSFYSEATNILITGDLSFQYDANAFFNNHLKGNLKVIIINNCGGNIFRVIDGPREQKERAEFFETTIEHDFSNLAKHFDLNYFSAKDDKELNGMWSNFMKPANRPSILEVFTDAELSANIFKEFYKNLQR